MNRVKKTEQKQPSSVSASLNEKLNTPLEYWRDHLEEAPLFSTLIADRPRSRNSSSYQAIINCELNVHLIEELNNIIETHKTELFDALFSAFAILLSRYNGEEDSVLGIKSYPKKPSSLQNSSDFSANILPLRVKTNHDDTFIELLKQVKEARFEANLHGNIDLNHLAQELKIPHNPSYHPLFQVMVILHHAENDPIPSSEASYTAEESTPLDLIARFVLSDKQFKGCFSYNANLYEQETIERFISHFENLLSSIVLNPCALISDLSVLNTKEREQILYDWNKTHHALVNNVTIPAQFEAQAALTPNQAAVFCNNEHITFNELNYKSNELAHFLKNQVIKSNDYIAVSMPRSIDLIIVLLGIVKSGAAYFIINDKIPSIKIKAMLDEIKPKALLYSDQATEKMAWLAQSPINFQCIDYNHFKTLARDNNFAGTNLKHTNNLDDILYIIYTSGSTGKPKAVLGTHIGMINRINGFWNKYPYQLNERCCLKTSLSFVDHVTEIFAPLLKGIPLYILSDAAAQGDIRALSQELINNSITRITLVPSLLKLFLLYLADKKISIDSLSHVVSSGEALPLSTCISFYQQFPNGTLINLYGSSEISADAIGTKIQIKDLHKVMPYFQKGLNDVDKYLSSNDPQNKLIQSDLIDFFHKFQIPESPVPLTTYQELINKYVIPNIVNVSSPAFIGHMTSVLPSFDHTFYQLMSTLNQNVVKIETSKALTFLEREAIAMLHHAFYSKEALFYNNTMQNPEKNLGLITSGGTQANITALWVARNNIFKPHNEFKGVAAEGMVRSLAYYGYKDIVLFISPLLHYSINKALSLLGIGTNNIRHIPISKSGKLDLNQLAQEIKKLKSDNFCVMAIIGIAGATETGSIDPLDAMSDIAREYETHFHVDGAFGGPFIFSQTHRHKLQGIDQADSITICGHKQLHLPLGLSLCIFKNPDALTSIYITTDYQATKTGFDFGKASLEGSRPALSLLLHANLHLLGQSGYEDILDENVKKAFRLKELIKANSAFELLWEPEINIVNYRYIPNKFRSAVLSQSLTVHDNKEIDSANLLLQKKQFENGNTFISKTSIPYLNGSGEVISLRAVIANPLSTEADIIKNLEEQLNIANQFIETEIENGNVLQISNQNNALSFEKTFAPIGKPLDNCQAYILDRHLNPVGIGMPGELYIAGLGLARGYLNQEDLTSKVFIQNPFSKEPDKKMYKTGDICRWFSDGSIEYLGRKDNQVKIRGLRIELGEIEAVINQHDHIKDCIITLREDPLYEKRLIAYLIPVQDPLSNESLREYLAQRLTDYMIPSAFIWLDSFPLTQSGKINRNMLPTPDWTKLQRKGTLPQDSIEEMIGDLWRTLLQVPVVYQEDDFFDLGGDSLTIIRMLTKLEQYIEYPINISAFLKKRTLSEFSHVIKEHIEISNFKTNSPSPEANIVNNEATPCTKSDKTLANTLHPDLPFPLIEESVALRSNQNPAETMESLFSKKNGDLPPRYLSMASAEWVEYQEIFAQYGITTIRVPIAPIALRFKGKLNTALLEAAVNDVINKHEVLRWELPPSPVLRSSLEISLFRKLLYFRWLIKKLSIQSARKLLKGSWKKQSIIKHLHHKKPSIKLEKNCSIKSSQVEDYLKDVEIQSWLTAYERHYGLSIRLIEIEQEDYLMIIVMDHLVSDGYSTQIFIDDLIDFYKKRENNQIFSISSPLIESRLDEQNREYSISNDTLQYWISVYQDVNNFQKASYPFFREVWPKPGSKFLSCVKESRLTADAVNYMKALAKTCNTSLYTVFLAHFAFAFSEYYKLPYFPVSIALANRDNPENRLKINRYFTEAYLSIRTEKKSIEELIQLTDMGIQKAREVQDIPWPWLTSKIKVHSADQSEPDNPFLVPIIRFEYANLRQTESISSCLTVDEYFVPEEPGYISSLEVSIIQKGDSFNVRFAFYPEIFVEKEMEHLFALFLNKIRHKNVG